MDQSMRNQFQKSLDKTVGILLGGKFCNARAGLMSEQQMQLFGDLKITGASEAIVTMSVPPLRWVIVRGVLTSGKRNEYLFEFDHMSLAVRRHIRNFISGY